ncbi:MAG TPA: hypothetical protein VHS29_14755 [Candidatus Acidoferrales bacterium]|jgi:hypothetical protein|nr:hypothetical protein [Candidatus Acidoferrales bacterium]
MPKISKTDSANFFPMPRSERAAGKKHKPIPYEFVLDAISSLSPWTRPMFGCLAVYVENKIIFILQDKTDYKADNGVWLATTKEHHESLRDEFPSMRSIKSLGGGVTGWQVLPLEEEDFEETVLRACELVLARDPRIGKIPGAKKSARTEKKRKGKPSKPTKKIRVKANLQK